MNGEVFAVTANRLTHTEGIALDELDTIPAAGPEKETGRPVVPPRAALPPRLVRVFKAAGHRATEGHAATMTNVNDAADASESSPPRSGSPRSRHRSERAEPPPDKLSCQVPGVAATSARAISTARSK
jgi:hypothetical protein